MSTFDRVLNETQDQYATDIEGHPLLEVVLTGQMQPEQYVRYLRETYHMVRHTPRMLALAGARFSEDRRELRNWFFEQVEEENNHDLFCMRDLAALGNDPQAILTTAPMSGSWGLVTQNYFMATYGNPVGILGVASLTEGLGATVGASMGELLVNQYGLTKKQVTFIRSHGGFDAKHIEDVKRAIDDLTLPEDIDDIVHARRMTITFYSQMFTDVLRG